MKLIRYLILALIPALAFPQATVTRGGTGGLVVQQSGLTITSPILVTPALGTPVSGVATNLTGTAAGLTAGSASAVAIGGVTGLGTGVATFLATPSSANLASAVTNETGSGALVFATSPTLVTPVLGAATATSINGNIITSGSGTLTLGTGKTLTASNTITLTGTDGSTLAIGGGGTLGSNAYTSTAYVPTTTTVNGHALSSNVVVSGSDITTGLIPIANGGTGTATPSLVAGTNVTISGTWPNQTVTAAGGGGGTPGGSNTQVQYNNSSAFGGAAGFTFDGTSKVTLGVAGTSVGSVDLKNATSGTLTIAPPTGALGTVTVTVPAATDTLVNLAGTQTMSNKTFVAPVLGVATATSVNKMAITAPATSSTLAVADGKTLTASNTITLTGTDGASLNVSNAVTAASAASGSGVIWQSNGADRSAVASNTLGTIGITTANVTTMTLAAALQLFSDAAPTTGSAGYLAFDNNAWATGHGAMQVYDGTANTYVVAALASDTPTNGQVPTWNTGGTVTWETPGAGSGTVTVVSSGSLTSTALVTGGGTTTLQTPSATSALDSSGNMTLAGNLTLGASTSSITGAAGNMTITAGTGNSRTMALRSTTSGGTATTFLTGNADQSVTFAAGGTFSGAVSIGTSNAFTAGTIELGAASDTTLSRSAAGVLAVEGVNVVTTSSTDTLTNKRITARITSISSSATPTVNTDNCDCVTITAQTVDITSMTTNLSGTPVNFDQLEYRIVGTAARAITWGASFVAGPTALPTTTVTTKALHVYFEWDSVQSKWVCISSGSDA